MAIEITGFFLCILISLSAILISIITLVHEKLINGNNRNKRKLPVLLGNMGLPWIGEKPAFYKAQLKNWLFQDFIQPRITRHGCVFKTRLMGSPTVVVSGAAANRFFLSNEFKLVVSSWPSTSVQLMEKESIMEKIGERHQCLRGVITEVLNPSGLKIIVPKICKTVEDHPETHWRGRKRVTLFESAKMLTFRVVMECLIGIEVRPGMLDMFERVLEGVFKPLAELLGSSFWRAKRARLEIVERFVSLIRKKREEMERGLEEKEEDMNLLTRLVKGLIRGEISEVEVIDNMVLLVFAAHDTTSFAIAVICKMLGNHPNWHAFLLQGTKAIVDIQYEGYTIPKGWKVLWTAYGTHYDKKHFPNSLSFNPSRFEEHIPPYVFIPFEGGPRICVGYQLAKLNILIFLHFMVTCYDWSPIHLDEPITMDSLPMPRYAMPINISPKF